MRWSKAPCAPRSWPRKAGCRTMISSCRRKRLACRISSRSIGCSRSGPIIRCILASPRPGWVGTGPGESKHADIGISLPGTAEEPRARVYVDGALKVTLKGDTIVADFLRILDAYVEKRFGGGGSANGRAQRHVAIGVDQT